MAAVSAGTDKRFRRAHVKPARKRTLASRQAWLAAKVVVALGLLAYGGWRGVALVAETHGLRDRPPRRARATNASPPAKCWRSWTACAGRTS